MIIDYFTVFVTKKNKAGIYGAPRLDAEYV